MSAAAAVPQISKDETIGKPVRSELPVVADKLWVRNPIDRFVRARLESESIEPSPRADRRTLFRRLSLVLHGLPPRPHDLEAFTPHSLTDHAALRRRLERIRRDGYVWTIEEYDHEVNGLATVVADGDGKPLASIGYFGPAYRLNVDACPDLAEQMVRAVAARTPTS